jgi:hypothetical protein
MYKCIVVSLMMAVSALVAAPSQAAEFSSLEERMSQAEFRAAGLDRLSPEELQSLNEWLRSHNAVVTKVVTTDAAGKPVFYVKDTDKKVVEDKINGSFSGWRGNNVFRLENGQEWTQDESGGYTAGPYDHPKVKIKPMLLGSWLMYVEPCGCSVRVRRTK